VNYHFKEYDRADPVQVPLLEAQLPDSRTTPVWSNQKDKHHISEGNIAYRARLAAAEENVPNTRLKRRRAEQ